MSFIKTKVNLPLSQVAIVDILYLDPNKKNIWNTCSQRLLNYLIFLSVYYEQTRWRLFQKFRGPLWLNELASWII
jgi:hypothetical protein